MTIIANSRREAPTSNMAFVPDLSNKTAIVTGANSGIGRTTAKTLARRGARVVLAVRNMASGERAAQAINGTTEVREIDASLESIRSFALASDGPIDLLVNNAGKTAPELRRTTDGFELAFGTSHLGQFALTNLLLKNIAGRVVKVGSQAERFGRMNFDDLNWERTHRKDFRSYVNSKLANLLFTAELQRRLSAAGSRVIATVAHPGFVSSNIYNEARGFVTRLMVRLLSQSPEMDSLPVLYTAVADIPGNSFVGPKDFAHMRGAPELITSSKTAKNEQLAKRLWTVSEQLTGVNVELPNPSKTHRRETQRIAGDRERFDCYPIRGMVNWRTPELIDSHRGTQCRATRKACSCRSEQSADTCSPSTRCVSAAAESSQIGTARIFLTRAGDRMQNFITARRWRWARYSH